MTQPAGTLNYQNASVTNRAQRRLKWLAVCWWIWSLILMLGGSVGLFVTLIGTSLRKSGLGSEPPGTPLQISMTFALGFSVFVAPFWGAAILGFLAAYFLPRNRGTKTCYWTAIWSCLIVPFGTVVGVWTLMALSRRRRAAAAKDGSS